VKFKENISACVDVIVQTALFWPIFSCCDLENKFKVIKILYAIYTSNGHNVVKFKGNISACVDVIEHTVQTALFWHIFSCSDLEN